MKITSVTVRKVDGENSKLKGFASVLIDDCFAIRDIKILDDDGLFIGMPSKRLPNGKHKDVAHPINKETRKMFEDAIFEEYNKAE